MKHCQFVQAVGEGGLIGTFINDANAQVKRDLVEVRAAVIMPVEESPGYFLFLGKMRELNENGKQPLIFMEEGESRLMPVLFQDLTDKAKKFQCDTVYVKRARNNRDMDGFFTDVFQAFRQANMYSVRIVPAPNADDVAYGRAILHEYFTDKALLIPKQIETTVRTLTRGIGPDNENDTDRYAFHCLRYLLAGFQKYQGNPYVIQTQDRHNDQRADPGGWT